MNRSLDIVALTQFLKDRHTLAMWARTNRDRPVGTRLSMLVGINHPLITLRALGNKVLVSSGTSETSTTTSNNTMKKFQVATKADVCLSLSVATMISRWIISTSTLG